MKNFPQKTLKQHLAFSLVETLAALVIAAMILSVLLMLYNRARTSALAITKSLDGYRLPVEILQRIAEDLDRLAAPGTDRRITIKNKIDAGYQTARLTVSNQIYDSKNKPRIFEKVVWQANYDPDVDSLVLYRSHSGLSLEDKLLDKEFVDTKDPELFIPLCCGLSFFRIEVPQGEELLEKWTGSVLPKAVVATISFATPFKAVGGGLDVLESEKITRTIAIDRTRKIKFEIVTKQQDKETEDTNALLRKKR